MPRLKGELENTVSEVSAGHPSSEFPLLVLPQGKPETLPETNVLVLFTSLEGLGDRQGDGAGGAWTWAQSEGGGVFQVASSLHNSHSC